MPTYIVQHTNILYGAEDAEDKGNGKVIVYAPGDEIELTEKEAELLGTNVAPVVKEKEKDTRSVKEKK